MYESRFPKDFLKETFIVKGKKVQQPKKKQPLVVLESSKQPKKIKEEVTSHKESINLLADQITKYLQKHKENPNSIVNDFSIGLFLGFSEFYAHDGDQSTNGISILLKVLDKVKILSKQFSDLIPEKEDDFNLDDVDTDEMEDELGDESNSEDESESEDDENQDENTESDEESEDSEEDTDPEEADGSESDEDEDEEETVEDDEDLV